MYIWLVHQRANNSTFGGVDIKRFVLTSTKRAEDAIYRLQQVYNTEGEVLESVSFQGYIPGISESSQYSRQRVFYLRINYLQPNNPSASLQLKRVVTEFYSQIDPKLAGVLGVEDAIGPIPTGPDDAIDVAKLGLVIALPEEDPANAREILQSHVFRGVVEAEDIYIEEMRRVKAEIL